MGNAVSADATLVPQRQHHLDRLKVLLTALVVFHHTAISYGAAGDWFYKEDVPDGSLVSHVLTLFCAVNQSFFMGMFFLLAGYLTPDSLQRKGPARFLKERLIRLGVPLLLFGFFLGPITVELAQGTAFSDLSWTLSTDTGLRFVMGPLWFCWALLIFSSLFVCLSRTRLSLVLVTVPTTSAMLASAVLVGLAAFVVRLLVPVGQNVAGLQLGYFVSYAVLFAVGCMATRLQVLRQLTWEMVRPMAGVSLAALPMLPALLFVFKQAGVPEEGFSGGWNLAALAYALWEPLVAWGVIGGLLVWGRLNLNHSSQVWANWTDNAYGAFVVHAPVLVMLSSATAQLTVPPLLKFLVVASLATLLSFFTSFVLRLVPGVKQVL